MKPFRLGLTGSIGMGKSTTAGFFADHDVPVWDADAAVHRLYAPDGAAVARLAAIWPNALVDGGIDRTALKAAISADPVALAQIEAIVHPLVAQDRDAFRPNGDIVVFDIPLLFEKGTDADMDATLLVTAPPDVQRARVMSRPGMTEGLFAAILARQMPDAEKRSRATHIIETLGVEAARACVAALVRHIRESRDA